MPNCSHQILFSNRKKNQQALLDKNKESKYKESKYKENKNKEINKNIPPPLASELSNSNNNNGNSFISSIGQGFSFGLGSSIAYKITNKITDGIFEDKNKEKHNCEELKKDWKICETNAGINCGRIEELYLACINKINLP